MIVGSCIADCTLEKVFMIPIPDVAPATLSLCALVPLNNPRRRDPAPRQRALRMTKHRVLNGEISRALALAVLRSRRRDWCADQTFTCSAAGHYCACGAGLPPPVGGVSPTQKARTRLTGWIFLSRIAQLDQRTPSRTNVCTRRKCAGGGAGTSDGGRFGATPWLRQMLWT